MTILYKPVQIESVEQAEALDGKTPIQTVLNRTQEVHDVRLFEDFAEDFWPDALEPGNRWVYVALVPIEAEEETARTAPTTGTGYSHILTDEDSQWRARGYEIRTRFVTPWEEA